MYKRFREKSKCAVAMNKATYFDLRELQLVENATQVVDLFVELVPNLALRVFEIHRQFVFEPCDLFAAHTTSNERHYHNDVTQSEGDPTDQEYLIHDEIRSAPLRIVLTCEISIS